MHHSPVTMLASVLGMLYGAAVLFRSMVVPPDVWLTLSICGLMLISVNVMVRELAHLRLERNAPRVIRLHISGNIAGGKSTILQLLASTRENVLYYGEDLGDAQTVGWTNTPIIGADGYPTGGTLDLLDAVCNEPKHRSLAQIGILIYNIRRELRAYDEGMALSRALGKPVVILIERPPTDASLFVEALSDNFTDFDTTMFYLYLRQGMQLVETTMPHPSHKVYIRTSPEECMHRIRHRGRPQESASYTTEYIANLHKLHEKMITNGDYFIINNEGIVDHAANTLATYIDSLL